MKSFPIKICVVIALCLILPFSLLIFTGCSKENPNNNNNNNGGGSNPPKQEQVVDENPNSPIKSGIYSYVKEELTLADMFYLDNGEKAIEHFNTRDINGVRAILSDPENEEKYGFQKFVESITKEDNIKKCVEFNTKNKVSTYLMTDGLYTKVHEFSYVCGDLLITVTDPTAPFILYHEDTKTVSLLYKFFYEDENGEQVFPHVYVKAEMRYECESVDMMVSSDDMAEFRYKEDSMKVVDMEGNVLDVANYSAELIETFGLDTETTTPLQDVVALISSYDVNVSSSLKAVLICEEEPYKFLFNSISNNVIIVRGIAFAVATTITDVKTLSEITVTVNLSTTVKVEFKLEKVVQTPTVPVV